MSLRAQRQNRPPPAIGRRSEGPKAERDPPADRPSGRRPALDSSLGITQQAGQIGVSAPDCRSVVARSPQRQVLSRLERLGCESGRPTGTPGHIRAPRSGAVLLTLLHRSAAPLMGECGPALERACRDPNFCPGSGRVSEAPPVRPHPRGEPPRSGGTWPTVWGHKARDPRS